MSELGSGNTPLAPQLAEAVRECQGIAPLLCSRSFLAVSALPLAHDAPFGSGLVVVRFDVPQGVRPVRHGDRQTNDDWPEKDTPDPPTKWIERVSQFVFYYSCDYERYQGEKIRSAEQVPGSIFDQFSLLFRIQRVKDGCHCYASC